MPTLNNQDEIIEELITEFLHKSIILQSAGGFAFTGGVSVDRQADWLRSALTRAKEAGRQEERERMRDLYN